MNKEELLARIADLEAAGIFTKEEADIKRAQIEAKFNTEDKAEEQHAEPAQEVVDVDAESEGNENIEDQNNAEKVAELVKSINAAEGDTWLEKAFSVLVPEEGKADTVAGELVRALMKIMYRWYNDGDYFYRNYGLETCGSCAEFLLDSDDMLSDIILTITENGYEHSAYEHGLEKLANAVETIVMNTDDLEDAVLLKPNKADCMNYSTRTIEEYAPTFEISCSFPDELQAHMDRGNINLYDIEDFLNDEFMDSFGPGTEVNAYADRVEIDGLPSEDVTGDDVYDALDRWAGTLTDDYGDPYFDADEYMEDEDNITSYIFEKGADIDLSNFSSGVVSNAVKAAMKVVRSGVLDDRVRYMDTDTEEGINEYLMEIGGALFDIINSDNTEDKETLTDIFSSSGVSEIEQDALISVMTGRTDNAGDDAILENKENTETCDLSVEIPEDEAHTLYEDYYCVSDGENPKNAQLFIDSPEGEKAALELAKANKRYKYVSKFVNGDEQIIWKRSDEEENAKDIDLEEAKKDLTTVKGTYSKLLNDNIAKIYAEGEDDSVSLQDYKVTILDIVKPANNTPAKATFEYKVSQMRSKQELMFYASNAALNGGGYGVNPWKSEIKESCEGCTVDYEVGKYDEDGQVIDSEAVTFVDEDEAIMFAEENGYDYVTGYTYDDGDINPKSSFEVWKRD